MEKMSKLLNMRKSKNLSQEEVAAKIGVRANTISQYELGKRNPNVRMLKALAEVLNCKVEDLI